MLILFLFRDKLKIDLQEGTETFRKNRYFVINRCKTKTIMLISVFFKKWQPFTTDKTHIYFICNGFLVKNRRHSLFH